MEWTGHKTIDNIEAKVNEIQKQIDDVIMDDQLTQNLKRKITETKKKSIQQLKESLVMKH